jgi:hypothetical protein
MYKLNNGTEIRTALSEMTIEEFDKISNIMNDQELMAIEKYLDIMNVLGVDDKVLEELTDTELFAIIKSFGEYEYENNLVKSVEIEGYNYVAYLGDTFSLKAKDMALIEKAIKSGKNFYANLIAIIFKREDLSNTEHWSPAHIKHKIGLFKNMQADTFYPYVIAITQRLNSRLQKNIESANAE